MNTTTDRQNAMQDSAFQEAFAALLKGQFPTQHQAHLHYFSTAIDESFDAASFAENLICDGGIDDDLYPLPHDTIPAALKTLYKADNLFASDTYEGPGQAYALCHFAMPAYWLNDPNQAGTRLLSEVYRSINAMGAKPRAHMIRVSLGNDLADNKHIAALLHSIDNSADALDLPAVDKGIALKFDCPSVKIDIFAIGTFDNGITPLPQNFTAEDQHIYVLGREHGHLGLSAFINDLHGSNNGDLPHTDLLRETQLSAFIHEAHRAGYLTAARSVSIGGIGLALADMAMPAGIGASVGGIGNASFWYGEDQARYVVTINTAEMAKFEVLAMDHGISLLEIGNSEEDELSFNNQKIHLDDLK